MGCIVSARILLSLAAAEGSLDLVRAKLIQFALLTVLSIRLCLWHHWNKTLLRQGATSISYLERREGRCIGQGLNRGRRSKGREGDPVEDDVAEEGCRTNEQDSIPNTYDRCVGDKGHHTTLTI